MQEEKPVIVSSVSNGISLQKISYIILTITLFLLPLFFISSVAVPFQLAKISTISLGVILSFFFFIVSVLKEGGLSFPKSKSFFSVFLIPLSFLISSLFSASSQASLFGYGFEANTFGFILVLSILFLLIPILFNSKQRIFYSYLLFFLSFLVILIFHVVRMFFGPTFISLGFFDSALSNTIGTINDLAVFISIGVLVLLVSLEMLFLQKLLKVFLYVIFFLALFLLAVINFSIGWILLGVFSLLFFVYSLSSSIPEESGQEVLHQSFVRGKTNNKKISFNSLLILVISVIFLLPIGSLVSDKLSSFFGISNIEVRPSWESTLEVGKHTLQNNFLVGSGPNRFSNQWQQAKPDAINSTNFWNADFHYGVGLIPTFFITTGFVGSVAIILFLFSFLYIGFKSMFLNIGNIFSRYLTVLSFFTALFLWIIDIIYVPSVVIFSLTFFFTGLFFASLCQEKVINTKSISFSSNPKASFISILILVLILVGTFSLGYIVVQKTLSWVYFQKSVLALNNDGNIAKAENYIAGALDLTRSDIYYRAFSELDLIKLNAIVSSVGETEASELVKREFQQILEHAVNSAQAAISENDTNYENWVALGKVYAFVAPFGVLSAYENAVSSFDEAIKRNPKNPSILLLRARLEASNNNLKGAKEYTERALSVKGNYTEAVFFLSQIQVTEGNLAGAISSVEKIVLASPNDPTVYFHLGILKYNNLDFKGAIEAFGRAIDIVPDYANAKYFLGLSYEKMSRTADAIKQFEDIKMSNPQNAEVSLILGNLKSGKDPFADAVPPIDDEPEKRDSLPLEETE